MSLVDSRPRGPVLDRYTLIAEVLFGLIMVLTFTGSLSVADAGRDDVRAMLIGALGCNIAWGIIDGLFFLMESLSEQGHSIRSLRDLRKAGNADAARQVIVDSLPPMVAATLDPADFEKMQSRLMQATAPPRQGLGRRELLGALSVFFWVFVTTFPVTIPFIFMDNLAQAMRYSNAIAIALLFVTGVAFGKLSEYRPWLIGIAMVVIGSIVVAATIALGG
jgi:VIT1/CCC1 family predicted Fe2+/Mn2+ transporter